MGLLLFFRWIGPVIERQATIVNQEGLHARPAARIVRLASTFAAEIELAKDGLDVNGKSIMGVMMLAAECGSSITIRANGPDAEAGGAGAGRARRRAGSGRPWRDPRAPRDRRLARRGVRAGVHRADGLSGGAGPHRQARAGGRRGPAAPRGGGIRRLPPAGAGPARAAARRSRGVAHLRRADPHGAGPGFPGLGRDPDPQQPAQRRDGLRVQGARATGTCGRAPPGCGSGWPTSTPSSSGCSTACMGGAGHELWSMPADEQVIVVAHELSPGLTVQLDREHVVGLISEEGTRTAHAAILAHSLGIPAVMGAAGALAAIPPGMMVLLDGQSGTIVLDPTRDELEDAKTQVSRRHKLELQLEAVVDAPAVTPGGPAHHAHGQRGSAGGDRDRGADGRPGRRTAAHRVPAHRTRRRCPPRRSRPTTSGGSPPRSTARPSSSARTTSAATSSRSAFKAPAEANPFLGWRSIRVCLDEPEVFRPQIRAMLRAAVDRDIQLMLPLVTLVEEVEQTRRDRARGGPRRSGAPGIRAAESVPVGVMIETPGGGADRRPPGRGERVLQHRHQRPHPVHAGGRPRQRAPGRPVHARTIRRSSGSCTTCSRSAARPGIPVSVCGEMASEPLSAVLLLGLGYDRLSVSPPALPLVKWVVRTVPEPAAARAAESALVGGQRGRGVGDAPERRRRVHRRPAAGPALGVARAGAGG